MDKKAQGSGSGKALGIGELLASACSANAPLERSSEIFYIGIRRRKAAKERQRTGHRIMPSSCC